MTRDWKEGWIDQMGLIVALGGEHRFNKLRQFKDDMARYLTPEERSELKEALRQRFTPTNGQDGCSSAMEAVKDVTN